MTCLPEIKFKVKKTKEQKHNIKNLLNKFRL